MTMRILLIEDSLQNGAIFVAMLCQHGYSMVEHKLTGLSGLAAARAGTFDLMLIDFNLPDLRGTQIGLALYHLMRRGKIPTAPLVALTAQADTQSVLEAQQLGFSGFIGKPCTESQLLQVVDHFRDVNRTVP